MGSIGSRARSSQATKAASRSRPVASAASTSAPPQPAPLPRTSPHTTPSTPPVTSARPAGPAPSRDRELPASGRAPAGPRQADRHVEPEDPLPGEALMTAPPTSGPLATASPVTAKKIPSAEPRRSGGKAVLTSAIARVITSAAPRPCTARPAMSALTSALPRTRPTRRRTGRARPRTSAGVRSGRRLRRPSSTPRPSSGLGVNGPLELLDRRSKVEADRAERGGDDERVERHHQRAQGCEDEGPSLR